MKKKIIIAGYPKSGNTWLTRLVANLVDCPVAGFWGSDHDEIASEGASRMSEFECYKAHQTYEDLIQCSDWSGDCSVIYIIRDPRDVALSGANFFRFYRFYFFRWMSRNITG